MLEIKYLSLEMEAKSVDTLNSLSFKEHKAHRVLYCILSGGCVLQALLISDIIKELFEYMYVYYFASAGVIPVLRFDQKKIDFHPAGYGMMHPGRLDYEAAEKFDINEVKGFAKIFEGADKVFTESLKTPGIPKEFIEKAKISEKEDVIIPLDKLQKWYDNERGF